MFNLVRVALSTWNKDAASLVPRKFISRISLSLSLARALARSPHRLAAYLSYSLSTLFTQRGTFECLITGSLVDGKLRGIV